jgi:hypothetical protein
MPATATVRLFLDGLSAPDRHLEMFAIADDIGWRPLRFAPVHGDVETGQVW